MPDLTPGVGNPPKPRETPLQTLTYQGLPLGMIVSIPKYEIPDGGAAYIQDALLNIPNITQQRGPLTVGSQTFPTFTGTLVGGGSAYSTAGALCLAVLEDNAGTANLSVFSAGGSGRTQIPWPSTGSFLLSGAYPLVDVKPRLVDGALVGFASRYEQPVVNNIGGVSAGNRQDLALWRGGLATTFNTGTLTITRGSTTGTVSGMGPTGFNGAVTAGMFVFDNNGFLVGTVKYTTGLGDTTFTLENPALVSVAGTAYTVQSLRGINPIVAVGDITCSTSGTAVTGQNTKFKKQGLDTGTWDIFRQRDWAFIGTVASVTSDLALTLSANAAIACNVDNYFAVRRDGNYSTSIAQGKTQVGFLNAAYANRQFYANASFIGKPSHLWFSELNLPECIDLSAEDGDFIVVSSGSGKSAAAPIKALMPGFRSLLILKDNETFALTGAEKEQFQVDKVYDDGIVSGMSAVQYQDQVIWAGRFGIYSWNGTAVTNLVEGTFGKEYVAAVKNSTRMWGAIVRDHYLLYIDTVTPNISVTKNASTTTPTKWTVAIDLRTGATSLWTNVDIRGAINISTPVSLVPALLVNTASGGYIADGNALFDNTGADAVTCVSNSAGPSFYVDSKRYALGDPVRRKLIKQIAMYYKAIGAGLQIDTIVGPGDTTNANNSSTFVDSTSSLDQWGKKRYKFLKHDNFVGFRFYPTGAPTTVVLGPFQIGFKTQAPGRI